MIRQRPGKNLTMDYRQALSGAVGDKKGSAINPSSLLSALTASQYAEMFPDYFRRGKPDIGISASGVIPGRQLPSAGAIPGVGQPATAAGRAAQRAQQSGAPDNSSAPSQPGAPQQQKLPKVNIWQPGGTPQINTSGSIPVGLAGVLKEQRHQFFEALDRNPTLKRKLLAIAANEQGTHPEGTQAVIEETINRAIVRGGSIQGGLARLEREIRWTSEYGYYDDSRGQKRAWATVNDKKSREILEAAYERVREGGNVSELAYGNASGRTAQNKITGALGIIAKPTKTINGETFFEPNSDEKPYLKNYSAWKKELLDRAKEQAEKGVESPSLALFTKEALAQADPKPQSPANDSSAARKSPIGFGDSMMVKTLNVHKHIERGFAKDGAGPKEIFAQMQEWEKNNPGGLSERDLHLSTGLLNSTGDVETVRAMVEWAKSKGANITLFGGPQGQGTREDLVEVHKNVEMVGKETGVKVGPPYVPVDGIHAGRDQFAAGLGVVQPQTQVTPSQTAVPAGAVTSDVGTVRGVTNLGAVDDWLMSRYTGAGVKWKDEMAAKKYGLSVQDYVIRGIDPKIRMEMYELGQKFEKETGKKFTVNTGFRDDYRQSLITTGVRARVGASQHGGSEARPKNEAAVKQYGPAMSAYGSGGAFDTSADFTNWLNKNRPVDSGIAPTGLKIENDPFHVSDSFSSEAIRLGFGGTDKQRESFNKRFAIWYKNIKDPAIQQDIIDRLLKEGYTVSKKGIVVPVENAPPPLAERGITSGMTPPPGQSPPAQPATAPAAPAQPATAPATTPPAPGQPATAPPPGQTATVQSGQTAPPPGQTATVQPGQTASPPGQTATVQPGQTASPPGQAGQTASPPGQAAPAPGQAASAPGQPPAQPGQAAPTPEQPAPEIKQNKYGGVMQSPSGEPIVMVDAISGKSIGSIGRNETIDYGDDGRVRVVPNHRTNPNYIVDQGRRDIEARKYAAETISDEYEQGPMAAMIPTQPSSQQPVLGHQNITIDAPVSASFLRASERSTAISGDHYGYGEMTPRTGLV